METPNQNNNDFRFLEEGGEMGLLMLQKDWTQTALGNPAQWPIQLKQATATMLSLPVPMLICWGGNFIQIYNDAFRPILGQFKHPAALGISAWETYAEIWETLQPMFADVMQGHPVTHQDFKLLMNRNGYEEEVYFDFSYSPLRDEFSQIQGVLVTCTETTDKVLNLARLKENEDRLRFALSAGNLGAWELDLTTMELKTSDNCKANFGQPLNQPFDYDTLRNCVHPQDQERMQAAVLHAINTGSDYNIDYRVVWPDDSIHWVNVRGKLRLDENEIPVTMVGVSAEITEQMTLNLELEKGRQRLKLAMEVGDLGDFTLNLHTKTATYSPKVMKWFGFQEQHMPFNAIFDRIHPDERQRVERAFESSLTGEKEGKHDITYRMLMPDDEMRYLRSIGKVQYRDGRKAFVAGMIQDVTSQVMYHKKIAESEARFRSLIEEAPIATSLYTGPEHKIEVANERMLQVWGKGNSVLGKPLQEALPEIVGQPFLDILTDIRKTGETYEAKGAKADLEVEGMMRTYYFDYTYKPLFDADGKVYGIINMAIDVTEQLLAQQRIEEIQRELLSSFEEAPVAIATISAENLTFRIVNPFYAELVGRKPADLINKPLLEALPELAGQGFDELLHTVISSGKPYVAKEVAADLIRYGELQTIYVDLTYQPRKEGKDKTTGVLVVATDVTEQVLTRRRIEEAETDLRNAIEVAGLATWKLNVKENTFFYSQRFMDWLGFSENTKNIDDAYNPLPDEYKDSVAAAIAAALAPGSSGYYDNEHPIINRLTGQTRIIHAQGQVLYDVAGEPFMLSGTAQDITLQRQLQLALEAEVKLRTEELDAMVNKLEAANEELETSNNQLLRSNAELAQFAYIASHDLQEPLRKISTFSQMLEKSLGEQLSEKSTSYLEKIQNATARMTALIRDVLVYSQLETNHDAFEKTDLDEILRSVVIDYDLLIEQSGAQIEQDELPFIDAIPLQMTQLFANLVGNALKFLRKDNDPKITIKAEALPFEQIVAYRLSPTQQYVKIVFSDNGIGLDPEYAEKIFNIFQRLHSKSEFEGTGIGLAMCKKIVLNHNGIIFAEGEKGVGARFNVILPLNQNHV